MAANPGELTGERRQSRRKNDCKTGRIYLCTVAGG